jgi:hypothetical protein
MGMKIPAKLQRQLLDRGIVGPQTVKRPTYLTEAQQTSPGYDLDKHHEGLARATANRLADTAAPTVSESSQS